MNALETINQARDALTVKRVYGDPYQQDGVTVIAADVVVAGGCAGGGTDCNRARDLGRAGETIRTEWHDADRHGDEWDASCAPPTIRRLDPTARAVLRVVERGDRRVEARDDLARQSLGAIARHEDDEVVAADVTDERVFARLADDLAQQLGDVPDEAVAASEPVPVVEVLEVIDVDVQACGLTAVGEPRVDLVRDAEIPRKARERIQRAELGRAPQRGCD